MSNNNNCSTKISFYYIIYNNCSSIPSAAQRPLVGPERPLIYLINGSTT